MIVKNMNLEYVGENMKQQEGEVQTPKQQIDSLLAEAEAKIKEAEKISDETGIEFYFSVQYGGGTYTPKHMSKDEALQLVRDGKVTDDNRDQVISALEGDWDDSYEGWQSSSANC